MLGQSRCLLSDRQQTIIPFWLHFITLWPIQSAVSQNTNITSPCRKFRPWSICDMLMHKATSARGTCKTCSAFVRSVQCFKLCRRRLKRGGVRLFNLSLACFDGPIRELLDNHAWILLVPVIACLSSQEVLPVRCELKKCPQSSLESFKLTNVVQLIPTMVGKAPIIWGNTEAWVSAA